MTDIILAYYWKYNLIGLADLPAAHYNCFSIFLITAESFSFLKKNKTDLFVRL